MAEIDPVLGRNISRSFEQSCLDELLLKRLELTAESGLVRYAMQKIVHSCGTFRIRALSEFADIEMLNPIKRYPWGQRVIRFYDPDHHVVEVGESMKVVVKRYLQEGASVEEAAAKSMFPVDFVQKCQMELSSATRDKA